MKKSFKPSFQIILLLVLSACLPNNNNSINQVVNIPSPTPNPISECKFNNLDYPIASQFPPINGENAIAYSNGESAGGLALFFPHTEEKVIIHQLQKLGLSGKDTNFSWSPTGTKIVFLHTKVTEEVLDNKSYLMLANLSEGIICPLVDMPFIYSSTKQFFWSPDEKSIAWKENGNISILNLETSLINIFSEDTFGNIQWIDSNHIAFIQKTTSETKFNLIIQSLDTSEQTIVLTEVSHLFGFSFSPDNKWLVYSYSKPNELLNQMYSNLIKLDTGVKTELGKGVFFNWSPNSQYLLGSTYGSIFLVQPSVSNQVTELEVSGCLYDDAWSGDNLSFVIALCRDGSKKAMIGIYSIEEMDLLELNIEVHSPITISWNSH